MDSRHPLLVWAVLKETVTWSKREVIEVVAVVGPPVQDCVTLGHEVPVSYCYNTSLGLTGLREILEDNLGLLTAS